MKLTLTLLLLLAASTSAFSQEIQKLEFCHCVDKVDQVSPVLNGKYERTCNGKVNETGTFKDGYKDGEWITYSAKGGLIKKINYADGKLNGKIELFYFDGKTKLIATFKDGNPDSDWIFYSSNGSILIEGQYDNGKPINKWNIYNKSKVAIAYDFTTSEYIMQGKPKLQKSGYFMRNDNSGGYFFFYFPEEEAIGKTAPLGGHQFAINMLLDLYEMPADYWDTCVRYEYLATVSLSPDHHRTFSLRRLEGELKELKKEVAYPFLVKTNPDSKITKIDHTELSRKLLDFKIQESFSFLPPWIFAGDAEVKIRLPYVINGLIDFSKPPVREYN